MRTQLLAAVLLAATACSSSSSSSARPSSSPAPPSASRPASGVLVAAATTQGLGLYRVGADRRAVLVRDLEAPGGTERPTDLALSGVDVCAIWAGEVDGGSPELVVLRCYAGGDSRGVDVPVTGRPFAVALGDGRIAWVATPDPDAAPETQPQELSRGRHAAGRVSEVDTQPVEDLRLTCGDALSQIAYAGQRLLVQCLGVDDDPGPLQVLGVPSAVPDDAPPYTFLTEVESADETTALAVQGEYCEVRCPDGKAPEPRRAVRVSLATGAVTEVVSTPAAGRYVASVSGGASGVVYVTRGADFRDVRVYLRLPGETRGSLVSSLPADLRSVVASS